MKKIFKINSKDQNIQEKLKIKFYKEFFGNVFFVEKYHAEEKLLI